VSLEIPLEKAEFGITLILDNVLEYVKETRILLSKSRTAHSKGLLQLAIQELGKAKLLKLGTIGPRRSLMNDMKNGKTLKQRKVRIEEFYDIGRKWEIGLDLLPEEAKESANQILLSYSKDDFSDKNSEITEVLKSKAFIVDWEEGDWSLPLPAKIFAGFEPSDKLLMQLSVITDAIEEAAKQLIIE